MTIHELKVWPEYYGRLVDNTKTFEIRKNDRDFNVGDVLLLREFTPNAPTRRQYSGSFIHRMITYILPHSLPSFGVEEGFCILAIRPLTKKEVGLTVREGVHDNG